MWNRNLILILLLWGWAPNAHCQNSITPLTKNSSISEENKMKQIEDLYHQEKPLNTDQMAELLGMILELKGSLPFNIHTFERVRNWEYAAINLRRDDPCSLYTEDMKYSHPMPALAVWCEHQCYEKFESILQSCGLVNKDGHRTWAGRRISKKRRVRVIQETMKMYREAYSSVAAIR